MTEVDVWMREVGQRIYNCRSNLGMTQEELAEKSGLTTQFISYVETGKRAMRSENLLKLSAALNVSTDYLLTGDIVDKDFLIFSDKLKSLSPSQIKIIEGIIDECNYLYNKRLG